MKFTVTHFLETLNALISPHLFSLSPENELVIFVYERFLCFSIFLLLLRPLTNVFCG